MKPPLLPGLVLFLAAAALPSFPQTASRSTEDQRRRIDQTVREVLASTGVPSASIAVVQGAKTVYVQAYGDARFEPRVAAMPSMRYSIGSISKQFTAAAILLLAEEGKLSLEDRVSKYVPDLTRANEVTIRQLLSHTSGYQDFWPQDYVPPMMLEPAKAERIMDLWARKPLDFDPGTKWQYSNTNFVIAAVIAEKVAGKPLFEFQRERIFVPLGMRSVWDIDQQKLPDADPQGYLRFALGPPRPAPKEGRGWLLGAAGLAMSAEDLAKWDIAVIEKKILKPASYGQMEAQARLNNGVSPSYGLGVSVGMQSDRRTISHGGEVSGFTAQNTVFPDDRTAVIVLTNQDAARASGEIARRIASMLFAGDEATAKAKTGQARKIFVGLQNGEIDRALLSGNASAYFTKQALQDFALGLKPLGNPASFVETSNSLRGGMTERVYEVKFPKKTLRVWTYELPDGKLEQYQVAAQ